MGVMMRWARVRGLVEGMLQRGRVEAHESEATDATPRPQDYGFAGNPGGGQGLYLEVNGVPVLLRVDRLDGRPQLDALEVAVWHAEGHMVKLKAGGVVELKGTRLLVDMSESVDINTPAMKHNGVNVGGTHTHGDVQRGGDRTGGPQ